MSNREKIIVILAAVAVIYGIYEYIFPTPPGSEIETTENKEDINAFIARINEKLRQTNLSPAEKNITEKIDAGWNRKIFVPLSVLKMIEPDKPPIPPLVKKPVYSGYLKMGSRYIAIINGMEYETGETIIGSGFELLRISPEKIEVALDKTRFYSIPIVMDGTENY